MLFCWKRTEPSPKATLTPPMWKLDGGTTIAILDMLPAKPVPAQVVVFGVETWL